MKNKSKLATWASHQLQEIKKKGFKENLKKTIKILKYLYQIYSFLNN